jgi:hypothetical protein
MKSRVLLVVPIFLMALSLTPWHSAAQIRIPNPVQSAIEAARQERLKQQQPQQQSTGRPAAVPANPSQVALPGNLGTAEGTAKLAESLRFLDVVGIKLGMEAKDVLPILKAANPNYQVHTFLVCADTSTFCDPTKRPPFGLRATDNKTSESLGLMLTPPPTPGFVAGVTRRIEFPVGSQPTVTAILDSLRKKYGPETANPDTVLAALGIKPFEASGGNRIYRWMFDSKAQLISWPKDKTGEMAMYQCGFGIGGQGSIPAAQDNLYLQHLYQFDARNAGPPKVDSSLCAGTTVGSELYVTPSGLVQSLTVVITNRTLYESGMATTWKWLDQIAVDKLEEERKRGQNVAAPKL